MRLTQSIWALLGRDGAQAPAAVTERIRNAMLDALDRECLREHIELDARIARAKDVEALWYLRSDLLHAISSCRDESVARNALGDITQLFVGLHPGATAARKRG
jgi:hypothetical protein